MTNSYVYIPTNNDLRKPAVELIEVGVRAYEVRLTTNKNNMEKLLQTRHIKLEEVPEATYGELIEFAGYNRAVRDIYLEIQDERYKEADQEMTKLYEASNIKNLTKE